MRAWSCRLVRGLVAAAVASMLGMGAAQAQRPMEVPAGGQRVVVDGDLVVAHPAALATGMSTGVGLGVTHGCWLAWGVRASWSTATEHTLAWEVTNEDFRGRVFGAMQHDAGRGTLALRLGVGGTLVHETRTRTQGDRAGLSGNELATSAWALLPAADLEGVVTLRVLGAWSLIVSAGPSLHWMDGEALAGWTGSAGVGWQP